MVIAVLGLPTPRAAAVGEFVSIADAAVIEGNAGTTNLVFTISASPVPNQPISGVFSTSFDGFDATGGASCAAGGADFVNVSDQPFTIAANSPSTTVTVTVCGDTAAESDESFLVLLDRDRITNGQCGDGLGCIATGTIRDDETLVTIASPGSVTEGNTGFITVNFTANISPAAGQGFSLRFATADGTATGGTSCATAGVDYISRNSSVSVSPGDTTETISVQVCGDTRDEPTQTLFVDLLDGSGYELGTTTRGNTSIVDNDAAPAVTITDVAAPEGQPCTTNICLPFTVATFTVALSRVSEFTVTVGFATSDGSATGGSGVACGGSGTTDYLTATGTLTFNPAQTSKSLGIKVCKDSLVESNQTYFVTLSNPTNATCTGGDCQGLGTIQNDDSNTGTFVLSPETATVATGEHLLATLTWTVPKHQVWRDLDTIDLRIANDQKTAIWVRWDEATNNLRLCQAAKDDPDPATGKCTSGGLPGSAAVLDTALARLHLAGSSVTGSGPTGRDVTIGLDVTFKGGAGGEAYEVAVAASDDLGNADAAFLPAGSVAVTKPG